MPINGIMTERIGEMSTTSKGEAYKKELYAKLSPEAIVSHVPKTQPIKANGK